MSHNALGAVNQQATPMFIGESSETISQAPNRLEILAYLNGALHDASLNKGKRIRFVQKDIRWLYSLKKLLELIGHKSWIYKEGKDRNLYVLETLCRDLDFKFNPLVQSTRKERIAYLRGFFDAEGGVPRKSGRFYIQLAQKNYEKIVTIKQMFDELGIKSGIIHNPSKRVDPYYWRVSILAGSYNKFAYIIRSWHPIKAEILAERVKI